MSLNYEKGKIWSWERASSYRVLSVIFCSIFFFSLFIRPFLPWWIYLSLFMQCIIFATYGRGIYIDARNKTVCRWWNLLGFKQTQKKKFSDFQGVYLKTRLIPVYIHDIGSVDVERFEVWLMGDADTLTVYSSGYEDEIRKNLRRITALMDLPEI